MRKGVSKLNPEYLQQWICTVWDHGHMCTMWYHGSICTLWYHRYIGTVQYHGYMCTVRCHGYIYTVWYHGCIHTVTYHGYICSVWDHGYMCIMWGHDYICTVWDHGYMLFVCANLQDRHDHEWTRRGPVDLDWQLWVSGKRCWQMKKAVCEHACVHVCDWLFHLILPWT